MNNILTLLQIKGIGRKKVFNLIQQLGDISSISLKDIPLSVDLSEAQYNDATENAKRIEEFCNQKNIHIVTCLDNEYPMQMRENADAPVLLYYKGDFSKIEEKSVAIIGTRKPSSRGQKIAERLGYVMGRDGYNVVSGLANGCDEFGHIGCLKANGYTVAVLPAGINKIYPSSNMKLSEVIVEKGGCLISEYPPEVSPQKGYFVERDRIQSMLSDGVIVVETDIKGGTMHTVEYARKYKKELVCYNEKADDITFDGKGNQYLIENKIAAEISDDADLERFRKRLDAYARLLYPRYDQMTIFEKKNQ